MLGTANASLTGTSSRRRAGTAIRSSRPPHRERPRVTTSKSPIRERDSSQRHRQLPIRGNARKTPTHDRCL
jgi:hypothetical protein